MIYALIFAAFASGLMVGCGGTVLWSRPIIRRTVGEVLASQARSRRVAHEAGEAVPPSGPARMPAGVFGPARTERPRDRILP